MTLYTLDGKDATPAQVKQADREFQKCAQEVSVGKDGVSVKLRSLAARAGFEGKIALEGAGLLRKGSFASGGEKKGKVKGFIGQELGKKPLLVHSLGKKILGRKKILHAAKKGILQLVDGKI